MTDLVDAYQRREVHDAERILKSRHTGLTSCIRSFVIDNRATILDDPFIRSYIGDLLRSLRTQYLIDLIKPYSRLDISFLAKVCLYSAPQFLTDMTQQLNVDKDEVYDILVGLILEGRVEGRIDEVTMRLELADRQ